MHVEVRGYRVYTNKVGQLKSIAFQNSGILGLSVRANMRHFISTTAVLIFVIVLI